MKLVENVSLKNKTRVFKDREHVGCVLAAELHEYIGSNPVILAVPLGGIPVAAEIARALGGPADLLPVARLPLPRKPMAGFGAVSVNGEAYLNQELINHIPLSEEEISEAIRAARKKLEDRAVVIGSRPKVKLESKTVIIADDGLNTGFTLLAAVRFVKRQSPKEVVIAVPTASSKGIKLLEPEVDALVCPNIRTTYFFSVVSAYRKWTDLSERVLKPYLL